MKNYILILIIIGVSCKKNFKNIPESKGQNSFSSLKVSSNFIWKTNRLVVLDFEKLPVYKNDIKTTFSVKSEKNSSKNLYQSTINFGEKKSIVISVPAKLDKLYVTVGSISKEIEIINNKVNFNYLSK